jgi:hypothetical protein
MNAKMSPRFCEIPGVSVRGQAETVHLGGELPAKNAVIAGPNAFTDGHELRLLGGEASEEERGILRLVGLPFTTWLVETDVMAERGEPILSLVSRVFLKDRERIMEQLTRTGHMALLYYMLQQVQQFRSLGEDFAMQHKDSEYLGEVEEELMSTVLEAIPAEKRLRGLSAEEVLRRFTPEERVHGLTPEELSAGLSEEQAARLRELLERKRAP